MRAAFALPTDLLEQRVLPVPAMRALRMVQVLQAKGAHVRMVEWIRWPTRLAERETRDGVAYERLLRPVPAGGAVARARFLLRLTRDMARALAREPPDGIVVQDGELLLAAARAAASLGVPLFYDSQEHWPGMVRQERPLEARAYDLLERRVAPRAEHVFTVSQPIAERFRAMGCEVSLVYNSRDRAEIEPSMLPREEAKRALGVPEDSFVLGFLGSITRESGLREGVAALPRLPGEVRLVVVGGPEEELGRVRAWAAEHGVAHRCDVRPAVSPPQAVRAACAFDAGLLALTGSGLNYAYRAPYKLFEYMGVGLPIVVSDYPEMRRIAVTEARCGLPVQPGSAASLAEAARRLHGDEALRAELAANARAAFTGKFSGERQKETLRASHPFWR